LISDTQAKEDAGFIGTALKYLDSNCPGFPRLILTGDDAVFASFASFNPNELVFLKTPDGLARAFDQLKHYVDNSVDLALKREYQDVFELFQSRQYDLASETVLLNVLKSKDETDYSKFGGILRDIRSLQETIYKTINYGNKAVVPDAMFQQNGMIKFNALMRHLNGNPPSAGQPPTSAEYQNPAVFNLSNALYWASGRYIHANPSEKYHISRYTIASLLGALMELFLWSKRYL
jgi:hypothetical protein